MSERIKKSWPFILKGEKSYFSSTIWEGKSNLHFLCYGLESPGGGGTSG